MKLIVTGHAEHGKDTACDFLAKHFGLKFVSSSYFVMEKAVIPYLAARGITYAAPMLCYADRKNHRAHWYDAIHEYNTPDKARMGKELFAKYDLYCGLRHVEELRAMQKQHVYDFAIWVDRSKHVRPEPETSMTIRKDDCNFVLDNNGTLADLEHEATRLYRLVNAIWGEKK